ncbi:MAG: sulfatase-like hydrolase/transferase [Pirellula sp.]
MNRHRIHLVGCIFIFCLIDVRGLIAADSKTNVVVLFVDDLGYGDIGPYGATKQATPNLDRMAKEGMKLTSFYAAPVCSVSRAQLLTGCYGARVSVPGVYGPGSANGLHPNEVTIAERLKERGYATMCIGKWHVGDQPEFLPTKQGFDHYFGIPYSNAMQRTSAETGETVVPLLRDDKVIELLSDEAQSQIVERYTAEAVNFIRSNASQPFFLYLPHTAVHTPIWPGKAFRGKSKNGRFGDWVEEVDWSVGRVMETLRELKLDQNTLVVFTSDNGPWLIKGPDGGSALPLRGGKGSTWEGGVRVPTIAWWPGKIAAGTSCSAVAGTIDLLPTAVSVAGGKIPDQPVIDGRDLSPLLLGKTQDSQREAHYYFAGYNLQAVRQGPWKLAIATQPEPVGKKPGNEPETNPRLYNLEQEIGEQTNLADKHPEIVKRLQGLIDKMKGEIGGDSPSARRPAGTVKNPQTTYPSVAPKAKADGNTNSTGKGQSVQGSKLKLGDVLAGSSAPTVAGKPIQIRCQISTNARSGVIVAHGGTSVGYALHLRDGALVFTTSDKNEKHEVTLPFPASDRPHMVVATLAKDGGLSLQVGDHTATAKSSGVLSRQPKENFCVGTDDGMPVTKYSEPTKFVGKIEQLIID